MSAIRKFARSVLPERVVESVFVARARAEHAANLTKDLKLDQSLLDSAQLLSDRIEMLKRMPKGGVVAEIGVAQGKFSQLILEHCEPSKLILIDPWDREDIRYSEESYLAIQKNMADEITAGQVELRRGYSYDAIPGIDADSVDWVYIDAAHDYQSVKDDLAMCARIVKHDGMLAGHDYIKWVSPTSRYGVLEAVNEFSAETHSPFVFLTNQLDKHDSFALRNNKL